MAKVNYSNQGTGEVLGFCRSFLRTAQTLQADLLRSWTAPPVESLDARYQSLRTRWIPGSWLSGTNSGSCRCLPPHR